MNTYQEQNANTSYHIEKKRHPEEKRQHLKQTRTRRRQPTYHVNTYQEQNANISHQIDRKGLQREHSHGEHRPPSLT